MCEEERREDVCKEERREVGGRQRRSIGGGWGDEKRGRETEAARLCAESCMNKCKEVTTSLSTTAFGLAVCVFIMHQQSCSAVLSVGEGRWRGVVKRAGACFGTSFWLVK